MTDSFSPTPPSGQLPALDGAVKGSNPPSPEPSSDATDSQAAAALWGAQEPLHEAHEGFALARQELAERDDGAPAQRRSRFLSARAMVLLVVVGTLVGCGEHVGQGFCEWLAALWHSLLR